MKLVCFNTERLGGMNADGRIVDLTALAQPLPGHTIQQVIEKVMLGWADFKPVFEHALATQRGLDPDEVALMPPVPAPSKILCYGLNFLEFGKIPPLDKEIFIKATSSLVGTGGTVVLPEVNANLFYHEAELAIVVGRPAYRLAPGTGLQSVFGYANFIDVTARGTAGDPVIMPNGRYSLFTGKSWDTFSPMGPWLVTADEAGDPLAMHVRLWLNGTLRQDFPMSDIAFGIGELVENVSHVTSLRPGDIITTGTNHSGMCALQHDDIAVQEITGLGRLQVSVSDPLRRSWPREPNQELLENIYRLAKR